MGRLLYGSNVEIEMDDRSLLHLDMLLADLNQTTFQLHVILGEARDGNLLSLSLGSGAPLALEYGNSSDLRADAATFGVMSEKVSSGGFVTLPLPGAAQATRRSAPSA